MYLAVLAQVERRDSLAVLRFCLQSVASELGNLRFVRNVGGLVIWKQCFSLPFFLCSVSFGLFFLTLIKVSLRRYFDLRRWTPKIVPVHNFLRKVGLGGWMKPIQRNRNAIWRATTKFGR